METKILGAFGEYLIIPPHIIRQNVFRKPANLSFEEACFLEPLSCVVHGVKRADIRKGGAALVFGAGPIGLLHLLLLKSKGAKVSVCDPSPGRLRLAKKLGAWAAFKPRRTGLKKSAPSGMDYVFECTGRKEIWQDSVNYLARGGTAVLFGGLPSGVTVTFPAGRLHYDEIRITGSFHFTPEDVKEAYGLLCSGKINVKPLISGVFPLEQTEIAFKRLSRGEGIKYVIRP
jgi:L-iditol 2-dehydrogenase